jgi:hypothetical protein
MGTVVHASELAVGDLYRTYSALGRDGAGEMFVRRVTARRTIKTVETYEVLDTEAVDLGRRGVISLRGDTVVERLDEILATEIHETLKVLCIGESLNITYDGGRFWE